jgi:molybdenum cofactor synthesis domain-containing protein
LKPGDLLTPARVGALAACGTATVDVYAKPRVAILSTGNEIVEPGAPLGPAQNYDINRYTLAAIVEATGGTPVPLPTAADTVEDLSAAIDRALEHDILVFSGGSSVGERDLILDALGRRGEIVFHGVAVKPGKPTAFGRVDGKPVIGMPGYPTSCLSNGYILMAPMLRRIARLPEYRPTIIRLPLAKRVVSTTGRHQFYTVRVENGAAAPAFKASGDITSMALADGYIEIPAHVDIVEAGELVDVVLF